MPVRKIPKKHLCVTGSFASRKNRRMVGFEFLLEKDHMVLIEYQDSVDSFEEQPVKIPVGKDKEGKLRRPYVPDALIRYRAKAGKAKKPCLAEVKSRRDLKRNAEKYKAEFAAARKFAATRNWEFRVFDETDIRVARLPNLKFLREYHLIQPDPLEIDQALRRIETAGGWIELGVFLNEHCPHDESRLRTLPVIWHLVATGRIAVNIDEPFTDRTPLSFGRRSSK